MLAVTSGSVTIYLVRHANAGSRSDWDGDDRDRPLNRKGDEQSEALRARYADRPITRVLSSPAVRCQQTVHPLAHDHGLEVQLCDPLDEGSPADEGIALLRSLAATEAVLCSHGDVIPAIMRSLIDKGLPVDGGASASKAGVYEIETDGVDLVSATYIPPPPSD